MTAAVRNHNMTYREVQRARAHARQLTAHRYDTLKRTPVPAADPTLTQLTISTRLVRHATRIVDADRDLVRWVTERIEASYKRPGRPRELSVRTALICYITHALTNRHFHVLHLPRLLTGMTWRTRRQLGVAYIRNGTPKDISYTQFLDLFHQIANVFDAWDDTLTGDPDEDDIRAQRASDLQQFSDRLLAASTFDAPMWSGNGALDATLKWSHERPAGGTLHSKIERRGHDGDAGPPLSLTQVVADADGDVDRTRFCDVTPAQVVRQAGRTQRPASWPSTWSLGSGWVGRRNKTKIVHGVAIHTIVRSDGPLLVEAMTITPAAGDPVLASLPMLRRLHDRRADNPAVLQAAHDGHVAVLGRIAADGAYTTRHWMAAVKKMNGTPVARLHRTNQEGMRYSDVGRGARAGTIATFNGRPVCECLAHTKLAELRFPTFPFTRGELDAYQVELAKTAAYEWKPNGAVRADGSRQYLAPHAADRGGRGGCEHCIDARGRARTDATGRNRIRCCTVASRLVPAEAIVLDQGVRAGSPEWEERWHLRNRVEGSYGILKNIGVIGYGRSYHHFVGLARETLVTVFAMVALNFHMLRQWRTRHTLTGDAEPTVDIFAALTSRHPSESMPKKPAAAAAAQVRTPRGMGFLAGYGGPDDPYRQ